MPDNQKILDAVNDSVPRDDGCRTVREVLSNLRRATVNTPLYVATPPGGTNVPWDHDGTGERHILPMLDGTDSYRGYYEDLGIRYGDFGDQPTTAGALAKHIRASVGTTMFGWKGGDFLIHPDTLTWVSRSGDVEDMRVDRFVRVRGALIIVTERGGRGRFPW